MVGWLVEMEDREENHLQVLLTRFFPAASHVTADQTLLIEFKLR